METRESFIRNHLKRVLDKILVKPKDVRRDACADAKTIFDRFKIVADSNTRYLPVG